MAGFNDLERCRFVRVQPLFGGLLRAAQACILTLIAILSSAGLRAEGPGRAIIQGPPPGWELVKITDDPELDEHVAMNNVGQIVFSKRMPDSAREEIFLYDNGKLRRLTFDNFQDQGGRINDNGTIVWHRLPAFNGDDSEIFRYRDGVIEQLTDNDDQDFRADITNSEVIMWSRRPDGETAQLVQYRDGVVTQITNNGVTNTCVRMNANEDFAWIAYDFKAEPSWRSTIMCSIGSVTHEITDGTNQPQGCAITNDGLVGWHDEGGIKLWQDGITAWIPNTTEDASGPALSNVAEILYASWNGVFWSPFVVRGETTHQLTNSEEQNMGGGNINDIGEVVLEMGDFPELDIWLMWRTRTPGDFTGDGRIDRFDFESMLNCLSNEACGTQTPPVCLDVFDLDDDGDIDFRDFAAFQTLVTPSQ